MASGFYCNYDSFGQIPSLKPDIYFPQTNGAEQHESQQPRRAELPNGSSAPPTILSGCIPWVPDWAFKPWVPRSRNYQEKKSKGFIHATYLNLFLPLWFFFLLIVTVTVQYHKNGYNPKERLLKNRYDEIIASTFRLKQNAWVARCMSKSFWYYIWGDSIFFFFF